VEVNEKLCARQKIRFTYFENGPGQFLTKHEKQRKMKYQNMYAAKEED
jgi:hypothetical protein